VVSSSSVRVIQMSARQQCDLGLRQAGHGSADQSQQAAVVAESCLHGGAGGQSVDIRLAQHDLVGPGDGQVKHRPEMRDLIEGQPNCLGSGPHAVGRSPGPPDGVAGKPEQAASPFGLDHLVGGKPESVQVFQEARAFARIGDSGGLQRIKVDHQRLRCRS
jgi:hypothetical protein